jgi:hypothetical protein
LPIKYDPNELMQKVAPKKKIKKLLSKSVTLKKTALSFLSEIEFLDRKKITETALKVVKNYQSRIDAETAEKKDLTKDPALLIHRVQNEIVLQVSDSIRENYRGEFYVWLPSDAEEPDPEHQLNYGKEFQIGVGEMPGERIGCRCGMQILVKENQLQL